MYKNNNKIPLILRLMTYVFHTCSCSINAEMYTVKLGQMSKSHILSRIMHDAGLQAVVGGFPAMPTGCGLHHVLPRLEFDLAFLTV
jgi:hypothetical protein